MSTALYEAPGYGKVRKLVEKAHRVNASRDRSEKKNGFTPESECPVEVRLRTVSLALQCGIGGQDWTAVTEAFALLQDIERDVRGSFVRFAPDGSILAPTQPPPDAAIRLILDSLCRGLAARSAGAVKKAKADVEAVMQDIKDRFDKKVVTFSQQEPGDTVLVSILPEGVSVLDRLEAVIERRVSTVAVGKALRAIRDLHLYREMYETFEDYCRERWEMDMQVANRLIESVSSEDQP